MDRTEAVNPIQRILLSPQSARVRGLYSCCSANEYVLRAAMRRAKEYGIPVLIESTANQVNQFGGYTGQTPADFFAFVRRVAREESLPDEALLIGGDHLGPLIWASLPAETAMEHAKQLVRDCVLAGYVKIHLDTSMRLGGDDTESRLPDETIARRGALLCAEAENAYACRLKADPAAIPPVYVIGSEVPIPGGALQNENETEVTTAKDCAHTFQAFRAAFHEAGLSDAWARVVAMVVQPGVEFADASVVEYNRAAAADLLSARGMLGNLVFEGHSTDYQTPQKLREMVEDGIRILKVGPALTFGLREGLFALEGIERELAALHAFTPSALRETIDRVMRETPALWEKYYRGSAVQAAFARAFSFSDRMRYYLPREEVRAAVERLMQNLGSIEIPLSLISQYMPLQYAAVRAGTVPRDPESLLIDRVGNWIDDYLYAITEGNKT